MQQENAGLPAAQSREENLKKLLTKVEKLGWQEMQPQIIEAFSQGLDSFTTYGEKAFGESVLEVGFQFGVGTTNKDTIYLNEMETLLTRPVFVPHTTIDGKETEQLEFLLRHLPRDENNKIIRDNLVPEEQAILQRVHQGLQWTMEKAPDVFNALMAKYNPPIDFAVPESMQQTQEALQRDTVRYNKVSSYFNLCALELYNAMDGRFPLKTLFITKDQPTPEQQQTASRQSKSANPADDSANTDQANSKKRTFDAYLKMDFTQRRSDGTSPIELIPANRLHIGKAIMEFHLEEMKSQYNRGPLMKYLEKGSLVQFTNANKTGEKTILLSTNPEEGRLDPRRSNGTLLNDVKAYLKNPLTVQVGAVVSMQKGVGGASGASAAKEITPPDELAQRFEAGKHQLLAGQGPAAAQGAAPAQNPAPGHSTNEQQIVAGANDPAGPARQQHGPDTSAGITHSGTDDPKKNEGQQIGKPNANTSHPADDNTTSLKKGERKGKGQSDTGQEEGTTVLRKRKNEQIIEEGGQRQGMKH